MKLLLLVIISTSIYSAPKRAPSQDMGDRISSEFGLDRFEKICEIIISGKNKKPRSLSFYDEIKKEECTKKGKEYLSFSSKKYSQVLVKHKDLKNSLIIKRSELDNEIDNENE
jgi:hypothetical protein